MRHGLSAATAANIVGQLIREKLSPRDAPWRRVALLDRLQLDLFRRYYRRMRPDFATFFSNSTAHLQHAYWREMEPEAFLLKPSGDEIKTYGDAIFFGYQATDRLLRHFFGLVDEDTVVILCSALSQQPFLKREDRGGRHFYRLQDAEAFFRQIGIAPSKIEPIMAHQYMLRFADRSAALDAARTLAAIRCGDEQVFGVRGDAPGGDHLRMPDIYADRGRCRPVWSEQQCNVEFFRRILPAECG